MKKKALGRYIVADPAICHGKPTFRGTRILVADVLEQVALGLAWESIIAEWRGSINEAAIAEAVRIARDAFEERARLVSTTRPSLEEAGAALDEMRRNRKPLNLPGLPPIRLRELIDDGRHR